MADLGAWAGCVIGDSLESVGATEKCAKFRVETRVVLHEPRKLTLYAFVRLDRAIIALEKINA